MLKILRLSTDQARAWRQNQLFLVDGDGKIVRPATREEADEWSKYQELGHDLQLKLSDERVVTFGSARAMLKTAILSEHGDTQIRWPNGIIITTVRDPAHPRLSPADQSQTAPSPSRCECANWGDPHPTRHHPVCQWNRYAPESERGDVRAASFVPGQPIVMGADEIQKKAAPLPVRVPSAVTPSPRVFSAPLAPPAAVVPEPGQCECKEWLSPDGTPASERWGHHPICRFYSTWLALHPKPEAATEVQERTESVAPTLPPAESPSELPAESPAEPPAPTPAALEPYFLYELDSRKELRPALDQEVVESREALAASGVPTIVRDDITYLVATRTMIAAIPS